MNIQGLPSLLDAHVLYTHVRRDIFDIDFHLHAGCEIFFLISGGVRYFVEKNMYPLAFGDLMITNNHEIHKPAFTSDEPYERITMELDPGFLSRFNTPSLNLTDCFYDRPLGTRNRVTLNTREIAQIIALFNKYEHHTKHPTVGSDQLKLATLMELLVFINQLFAGKANDEYGVPVHQRLTPVLDYIDQNLTSDLSLATLERKLFLNRYYLSKLFKQHIGSTVHEYIIYKRISVAKRLLAEGYSVREASSLSGFQDYTSFLKMFKRTVGELPRQFAESLRHR